jgi:hypothetical protein
MSSFDNNNYCDNDYGQFIDLESQRPLNHVPIDIYSDNEYNEYLDRCEHALEYGPPAHMYMNRNEIIPLKSGNIFTNPVFYVLTYLIQWIRR